MSCDVIASRAECESAESLRWVWQEAKVNPVCTAADLAGFPTWIIGGQKLSGEQTFDQLEAALSKL